MEMIVPFPRSWEVLEKGGFSNWLWKSSGFLFGKILKHPEIDITQGRT